MQDIVRELESPYMSHFRQDQFLEILGHSTVPKSLLENALQHLAAGRVGEQMDEQERVLSFVEILGKCFLLAILLMV